MDNVSYASSLSSTPISTFLRSKNSGFAVYNKNKDNKNNNKMNDKVKRTSSGEHESSTFNRLSQRSILEQLDEEKNEVVSKVVKVLEDNVKKHFKGNGGASAADDDDDDEEEEEEEEAACYLCHCGIDCSDRALFFQKDRKKEIGDSDEDDYYFKLNDPYLPTEFYDPHNALVYCDGCDRMFHQKCHFVPILKVPQGEWKCLLCTSYNNKHQNEHNKLFASPPLPDQKKAEMDFEFTSSQAKAKLWQQQLKSAKTFLNSQASNIRMAQTALDTLTSTKRNRAMLLENKRKSQELAQTLLRITTAKWKLRQALLSLEDLRTSTNNSIRPEKLLEWCQEHPKYAHHVIPNGIDLFLNNARKVPRTREMKLESITSQETKKGDAVPIEIVCSDQTISTPDRKSRYEIPISPKEQENKNDDNDSGITLDDLQCCICMVGDSTDENDVVLCDGEKCYRAFHMKCVHPHLKREDIENEDEDWFCPLCSAISNFTHQMQIACEGEDDENEKEWDSPDDVFPNSQWEYEVAIKYSQGKQNDDIQELLRTYLGEDIVSPEKGQATNPIGSDSEDENDYSLFDEESFKERKEKKGQELETEEQEDDGDRSSQATWLSSSVELNIGRAELAALSEDEDTESSRDSDTSSASSSGSNNRRRSRRLRAISNSNDSRTINNQDIGADFDESNILEGKRRRKAVDYQKLNDALFGTLDEKQKAKLDDEDDYQQSKKKMKKRASEEKSISPSSDDDGQGFNPFKKSKTDDDNSSFDDGGSERMREKCEKNDAPSDNDNNSNCRYYSESESSNSSESDEDEDDEEN
jgi:hypothetical protein